MRTEKLGYSPVLDGFRGLSAMLVVLGHLHILPGTSVDPFFVLSGFLISTLLLEEYEKSGRIDIKQFYWRRGVRLLPALYVFLTVVTLYQAFSAPHSMAYTTKIDDWLRTSDAEFSKAHVAAVFFYVANWLPALFGTHLGVLSHCWSLGVEEQFYFLWPLALAYILRAGWSRRRIVITLLTVAAMAPVVRIWLSLPGTFEAYYRILYRTDAHLDALMIGCLTAFLAKWGMLPRGRILALGLLAIVADALFGGGFKPWVIRGGATLTSLGSAMVIVALLNATPRPLAWFFGSRPLVWLGKLSYSLYLWHPFAIRLVLKLRPESMGDQVSPAVLLPYGFALIFLLAIASHYLVERPLLRLKRSKMSADGRDLRGWRARSHRDCPVGRDEAERDLPRRDQERTRHGGPRQGGAELSR